MSAPQAYNGAVREQLGDLQRGRVIGAMFDVAAQRGAGSASVAHIVERAGVSRRTFYELFTDREDCLRAAFEQALSYAAERVVPAYEVQAGWRERIRAGLIASLRFLDEQPLVGRLLIVEAAAGGALLQERRAEILSVLTDVVDQGREQAKAVLAPQPLMAEGVVGGVLAVIQSRLLGGNRGEPLSSLTNPLMSMIVLPYMGAAAARKELERSAPKPAELKQDEVLLMDPFKAAGMRLTYRTVRVLMAISDHPGASNRLIGNTAGITDQGQISKLLARLQRIGLVQNAEARLRKGAPNSWTITSNGRQVITTIRAHTEGATVGTTSDEAKRTHPHRRGWRPPQACIEPGSTQVKALP